MRGLTRPVLVGHSLGAAIGIRIALDRPGLLGGLVLVAPSSTRGLDFLSAQQIEVLAHPTSDDELVALARAAFRRPPAPEVLEQVMAIVRSASPQHIEGAVYSSRDFRVEEELRGLTCRTLLIAGDRDKHVPLRNHLATAMAVPRCGLQVFTDVGHVPFVEVRRVRPRPREVPQPGVASEARRGAGGDYRVIPWGQPELHSSLTLPEKLGLLAVESSSRAALAGLDLTALAHRQLAQMRAARMAQTRESLTV